ncbi:MAG: hypothetical protein ACTS5Y_06465 [Pollutimonas bauzanensis]|uniref:hypothetical protein n=1 Tax=Pollutimonas bauzanensis TaxID=658167 RepID=UPI00116091FE|nr:hypothetical protein [Pollutimonas bauzanensis]
MIKRDAIGHIGFCHLPGPGHVPRNGLEGTWFGEYGDLRHSLQQGLAFMYKSVAIPASPASIAELDLFIRGRGSNQ